VLLDDFVSTDSGTGIVHMAPAYGEDDFRTIFGILVSDPENSVDDNEWSIEVPEEKLESTITVM
jgi:isoleucyl-tRNA synthetase